MTRVLMIFLDGVGIGGSDPDVNPFMRARLDTLEWLLGSTGPLVEEKAFTNDRATLVPLDAKLGVAGLPQSGTGHTALLTGINAAREFGRHFGPWVPTALRNRLAHENVLTRAKAAGRTVAFANAYPEELFDEQSHAPALPHSHAPTQPLSRARRTGSDPLRAGPPIAALGAGVLTRRTPELARGTAVASEITNDGWRQHLKRTELPIIAPAEAGRNLARIAAQHDLTLFAHYATDDVGHRGHMYEAVDALQKIDEFLSGILAAIPDDTCVAIVSDHGNIEDLRIGHTYNPALGLFVGADHTRFARSVLSIADVAPQLLDLLDVSPSPSPSPSP